MNNFIEVTSAKDGKTIYINIHHIGHFYEHIQSGRYSQEVEGRKVTTIGVTTHNNGGFEVLETPKHIFKKIENLQKKLNHQ